MALEAPLPEIEIAPPALVCTRLPEAPNETPMPPAEPAVPEIAMVPEAAVMLALPEIFTPGLLVAAPIVAPVPLIVMEPDPVFEIVPDSSVTPALPGVRPVPVIWIALPDPMTRPSE